MSLSAPRRRRRFALGAALLTTALSATACASPAPAKITASHPAAPPVTPLATSVTSADGSWAVVPMGNLEQPANTFWQLLFEPAGSETWANQVEATAVATNGGIVLATATGGAVIAGVRPSELLHYSPLITTIDAARSWSNGVIDVGLAPHPDSLNASSPSAAVALVEGRHGTQVLRSSGGLGSWRTVTDEPSLASTAAGRSCGLLGLTAVSQIAGDVALGVACQHAGVVGILTHTGTTWRLVGPTLPSSLAGERAEVVGLRDGAGAGADSVTAVVAASHPSSSAVTDLVVAAMDGHDRWTVSAPLPIAVGDKLASTGPTTGGGTFALLRSPPGAEHLFIVGPHGNWQELPTPPPSTATIAAAAGSDVQALAPSGSTLRVWDLGPGADHWTLHQVLHVAIQYGSSS